MTYVVDLSKQVFYPGFFYLKGEKLFSGERGREGVDA
jgi:hypothetical protein